MGDNIEVRGTDKVLEALANVAKRAPAATIKAITGEAQVILRESVQLCPVDTGRLRQSAYVKPTDETHVAIGYGADYALAVHERTEAHHENGTQAKFLTTPIDAHRNSFARDVADRIKADGSVSELTKGGL